MFRVSVDYDNGYSTLVVNLQLQWRHNELDGVSNHRRIDCLLNRCSMKKNIALRYLPLWEESTGNQLIPLTRR